MADLDELLRAGVSWPSLVLILIVFGFAPGFFLRMIVLAYPRSDPRRAELIAELYAVPRGQRPLWVAEQLEVALFEGLARRMAAAARRPRHRRLALGTPIAAAFAVIAIGGSAVGLVVNFAQPGDQLWGVTKMLYSDYARSVEAAKMVSTELNTADTALKEGRTREAKQSLGRAQKQLTEIAEAEGRTQLVTQHHRLEEMLQDEGPEEAGSSTSSDPFTTSPVAPLIPAPCADCIDI